MRFRLAVQIVVSVVLEGRLLLGACSGPSGWLWGTSGEPVANKHCEWSPVELNIIGTYKMRPDRCSIAALYWNRVPPTRLMWTLSRSWIIKYTFIEGGKSFFCVEVMKWSVVFEFIYDLLYSRISAHQRWCTDCVKSFWKIHYFIWYY